MPPNPAPDQGHSPAPGSSEGPRSCFAIDVPAGLLARARSGERAAFEQISDKSVLVLSSGELNGLQNGDVIQSVDGRQVDSPREVIDALRDKPANARVAVGYMRDRKTARTTVTVPEMLREIPVPPVPPAPPRPPSPLRARPHRLRLRHHRRLRTSPLRRHRPRPLSSMRVE